MVYQKLNGETYKVGVESKARTLWYDNGAYISGDIGENGYSVTSDGKLYTGNGDFIDNIKKTDIGDFYINERDELIRFSHPEDPSDISKIKFLDGIKTWHDYYISYIDKGYWAIDTNNNLWVWSDSMFPTLVKGDVLDFDNGAVLDTNLTLWKYKSENSYSPIAFEEQPEKIADNVESINWCFSIAVTKSGESIFYGDVRPVFPKPIKVIFDGTEIKLTLPIKIIDGRTMYPFCECLEAMGARVSWDDANQVAVGELDGNKIEFKIDSNEYKVNGKAMIMDVKTFIDETVGRTYIPIRYAAEGLGFNVEWQSGDLADMVVITK